MSHNYEDLFDADVFDQHGTRVGPVGQVYLDDQTGAATWATVKTGLFGLKETFVPLSKAVVDGQKLTVPYDAQLIKDAPRVDPDKHLDAAEEAELYAHYGITNVMAAEIADEAPLAADEPAVEEDPTGEAAEEPIVAPEAAEEIAEPESTEPVAETAAEAVRVSEEEPAVEVVEEEITDTTELTIERPVDAEPARAIDEIDLYGEVKDN